MTLILSLATNEFVIEVADRRLTRGATVVTDAATKAVVYCNFMALGYTGLAEICGERTDIWITKQLVEAQMMSPWQVAAKLRAAASVAFSKMDPFPHAFTAIGWLKEKEEHPFLPFIMRVSNYHDTSGIRCTKPLRLFSAQIAAFSSARTLHFSVTGQDLTRSEKEHFRRSLTRAMRHGVGQTGMVQLLAYQIRQVAARTHAVGKDLSATCVPRGVIRDGYAPPNAIIKGRPSTSHMCFLDLPERSRDAVWYHPHVVAPGVRLTNVRLEKSVKHDPQSNQRAV